MTSERGFDRIALDGGATINAAFASRGLIDELCITVAPSPVRSGGSRIVGGADAGVRTGLELVHVLEADGYPFLRYRPA